MPSSHRCTPQRRRVGGADVVPSSGVLLTKRVQEKLGTWGLPGSSELSVGGRRSAAPRLARVPMVAFSAVMAFENGPSDAGVAGVVAAALLGAEDHFNSVLAA